MNDLLKQISSYNLFNYFLPGILFAAGVNTLTPYSLGSEDLLVAAFIYYFTGMLVSRFGSVVFEPVLRKTGFVRYASYSDFVAVSKEDSKLETLSETNNTYRSLLAATVLLGLAVLWAWLEGQIPAFSSVGPYLLFGGVVVLLLFAYRKQTDYIRKRVEAQGGTK